MKRSRATRGFSAMNKVELIRGGKPYFELLLKLINEAEHTIHLHTYILDKDETGQQVTDALKDAAKRKVKVYLMADGYASQSLPRAMIQEIRDAGVQFRFFEPVFKSKNFYFGRRMHHKVFVADSRLALTGGINISNRYNDMPGEPAWLDFALFAEGELADELCAVCWNTWNGFIKKRGPAPCGAKTTFNFKKSEGSGVRIRRNDWVRRKNEISGTYIEMFRTAQSHITILCSYFLPGRVIRRVLANAVKRGVRVMVITAGPSDVMMAKRAERWMYDWLLRNKIKLYEYQSAVLHSKVAACDGNFVTIGSYNINDLSAYASIELNVDVRDDRFAKKTEETMQAIIEKECLAITREGHRRTKNIFRQFKWWLSYHFIRIILYLFTFYYHRQKRNSK